MKFELARPAKAYGNERSVVKGIERPPMENLGIVVVAMKIYRMHMPRGRQGNLHVPMRRLGAGPFGRI
jgi:hypothetical protein